jgi:hypothetical protein
MSATVQDPLAPIELTAPGLFSVCVWPVWHRDGLAVHRGLYDGVHPPEDWTISHVASGYSICRLWTRPRAIRLARQLLPLADWTTMSVEAIKADSALLQRVRETAEAL